MASCVPEVSLGCLQKLNPLLGFHTVDFTSLADISVTRNKCDDAFCPKNQKCVSATSSKCECIDGFMSNVLGHCKDVDECDDKTPCDVNADCINSGWSIKLI